MQRNIICQTFNIRNIELFTKAVIYLTTPLTISYKTHTQMFDRILNKPYELFPTYHCAGHSPDFHIKATGI